MSVLLAIIVRAGPSRPHLALLEHLRLSSDQPIVAHALPGITVPVVASHQFPV